MRTPRLAAAFLALALLAGCSSTASSGFTVTGTVEDTTDSVAVPILAVAATSSTDAGTVLGLGATVRVSAVKVAEGDTVAAGQVVASLDDGTLKAQVEVAKADQQAAKAQVGVLAGAIETTYDKAQDVKDALKKVDHAISKANKAKVQLAKGLKQLKAARPELVSKLAAAQKLLANYPPVAVPGVPTKPELQAAITQLKAALKTVDANIAKIKAAQPKLAAGLKKAHQARAKLNDAAEEIVDARAALKDAKELATIVADAAGIPVEIAEVQLGFTRLTAPTTGVVTHVARVGDMLSPGASAVDIRPDGPSTVALWLSPAQAARVCVDDAASLVGDWMPAGTAVAASVTRLGTAYEYPPSDVTTDEIHLTRALPVWVTTTNEQLPAGVPVDVTITGCHPAAQSTNG